MSLDKTERDVIQEQLMRKFGTPKPKQQSLEESKIFIPNTGSSSSFKGILDSMFKSKRAEEQS